MNLEDEQFFAWLDGELPAAEAERMAARVAKDARLNELARQHRQMQSQLKAAFDPIAAAPLPERFDPEATRQRGTVLQFPQWRTRPPGNWPQWTALAATLALGIFGGTMLSQRSGAPFEVTDNGLVAVGSLDRALDTQLASAPQGQTRIGLTFRGRDGAICRTFSRPGLSGVACRADDEWQLEGMFGDQAKPGGDYRMASGSNPGLANLVENLIESEVFDAEQERRALKAGWR